MKITFLLLVVSFLMPQPASSLKNNIIAYWSMEQASGATRIDATGHGHSLSNYGSVGQGNGRVDYAASFNGASYLRCSTTDLSVGNGDFTIAAWVKISGAGEEQDNPAIICKLNDESDIEWSLNVSGAAGFSFTVGDTNASTHSVNWGAGEPAIGDWYFVVAWYDTGMGQIGIQVNNGAAVVASHNTGVLNGTAPVTAGYYPAENFYLQGSIDAMGIWSRKLTGTEKTTLWNSGNGIQYPF